MRVPLSWIRDFTPVEESTDVVVAALNQLGLEVEGVDEPGREIAGVRVARILDVLPHPNADRLQLADIEFGDGSTRVVCGAPNIATGMLVPFAAAGIRLPGGITLERRTIRGETSDGMILSAAELGLGDDHSGIVELPSDAEIGAEVRDVLGLDDVIFDVSVTPNRPDAMCVVGVARELAAHFQLPLEIPNPVAPTEPSGRDDVTVAIEDPERCPRYVARVATVTPSPSPPWIARRLVKAGVRSINSIVDVTNYVLLERNQPLHAFDLDRLAGSGIVVRTADDGERITTLDGVERTLEATDLLICDAHRAPQALAGIMGGSNSEISDETRSILLEAAYFEPMGIARSSKRLKLRSESSARFERGIDPDAVGSSAERALELLGETADARVDPLVLDEQPIARVRPQITVRTSRVNAVLGTGLSDTDIVDALAPLGIETEGDTDAIVATIPSWRPDLTREIDLVEEVARRVGFDEIGRTVPETHGQIGGLTPRQRARRAVADALVGAGLSEAVTLSLVAPDDLERSGAPVDRMVAASNPLRAEESVLRTRILPGLLRVVARNRAHDIGDVALFEIGHVFLTPAEGRNPLPEEPEHLAIALAGTVRRRPIESDRPVDVHDVVDYVRIVADTLELADLTTEPTGFGGLAPGSSAAVRVDGRVVGRLGALDERVRQRLDLEEPVVVGEVDLGALEGGARRSRAFRPPSRFPASNIDLAFVVGPGVTASDILTVLGEKGGGLLESARCFDEFRSAELGDRRSLAFALRFRSPDRTLTDSEVAELRSDAIAAIEARLDATLRV